MRRTKHSLKIDTHKHLTNLLKQGHVRMQLIAATSTQSSTIQTSTGADVICTFTKKLRQCKTQFLQTEESTVTSSTGSANCKPQPCRIIVDCDLLLDVINTFPRTL